LKILIGVFVLCVLIFIGIPFEINDPFIESILKVCSFAFVFFLLFLLFKQASKVNNDGLRIGVFIVLGLLLFLFFFGALWNNIWITQRNERNSFYTLEVWTNNEGTKILREMRETSGSIYDYRDRLVIYEFDENNRISINANVENYKGPWKIKKTGKESKNKLTRHE
jgi:hypothetical protein